MSCELCELCKGVEVEVDVEVELKVNIQSKGKK